MRDSRVLTGSFLTGLDHRPSIRYASRLSMSTTAKCEIHAEAFREEPHPHKPGATHRYCPECRKEAIESVKATAHLTDDDIREQQRRERIRALKPGRRPTSSYVLRGGLLVPNEAANPVNIIVP